MTTQQEQAFGENKNKIGVESEGGMILGKEKNEGESIVGKSKSKCKCEECGKEVSWSNITFHQFMHRIQKDCKCLECGRQFINRELLYVHSLTHKNEEKFNCGVCGERFKEKKDLQNHIKNHSVGKEFMCRQCGQMFTRRSSLECHLKAHGREKVKKFKCEECGKRFMHNAYLPRHVCIKKTVNCIQCGKCGLTFTSQSNLEVHSCLPVGKEEYVNSGKNSPAKPQIAVCVEERHACEICQRKFNSLGCLKKHWYFHTGNKPYECGQCSRLFLHKFSRDKHLLDHAQQN